MENFKIYNFGNFECMDLSELGRISYNRARKIRNTDKTWKFPSSEQLFYIGGLKTQYNLGIFTEDYYWTNRGVYESAVTVYKLKGYGFNMKKTHAGARFILTRNL